MQDGLCFASQALQEPTPYSLGMQVWSLRRTQGCSVEFRPKPVGHDGAEMQGQEGEYAAVACSKASIEIEILIISFLLMGI